MDEDESKEKKLTRTIESEMKQAFIDYSMSVIMSRALPEYVMDSNLFIDVFCML